MTKLFCVDISSLSRSTERPDEFWVPVQVVILAKNKSPIMIEDIEKVLNDYCHADGDSDGTLTRLENYRIEEFDEKECELAYPLICARYRTPLNYGNFNYRLRADLVGLPEGEAFLTTLISLIPLETSDLGYLFEHHSYQIDDLGGYSVDNLRVEVRSAETGMGI